MTDLGTLGNLAWRDWNTDGVPSSGPYKPLKGPIREFIDALESSFGVPTVAALKSSTARAPGMRTLGEAELGDGLGEAYSWHAGASDTANEPFVVAPTAGPAGRFKMVNPFKQAGIGAVLRRNRDKLREVELSVEDFWLAIDADDTNAINRAIAAVPTDGGTVVFNRAFEQVYQISAAISVTRGNISLKGKHEGIVEINSTSTTANHFTIGAAGSAYIYNIHLSGLTFTRSSTASAGWAVDMTNVGYSSITRVRVYGDNKQYQGIRTRSCNRIHLEKIKTDHCQKECGFIGGLGAVVAGVDGTSTDVFVDDWYNGGGHAASSSLATQGAFVVDDFSLGIWIDRYVSHSHNGYALYLRGTAPNFASNTLVYISGLNVESSDGTVAGALRTDYFSNVYACTNQWVSGRDLNAVHIGTGSSTIRYEGGIIAIAYDANEAAAFYCNGTDVWADTGCVGYSTNAHGTGIDLGPDADRVIFTGGFCAGLAVGLDVATLTGRVYGLTGVDFYGNGVNTGFDFAGSHSVRAVNCYGLSNILHETTYLGGTPATASVVVNSDPSNVNRVVLSGAPTGQRPYIAAAGADADIGMLYEAKGIGGHVFKDGPGNDLLGLITQGFVSSGATAMYLTYHNGSGYVHKQVTLGAADSGGSGFKALRVPNT